MGLLFTQFFSKFVQERSRNTKDGRMDGIEGMGKDANKLLHSALFPPDAKRDLFININLA